MGNIIVDTNTLPSKIINNVKYKFIFDESTGAKYLIMRIAEIPPGGSVPKHIHEDEEQVYLILEGEGIVIIDGKKYRVRKGYAVYIPMNAVHEVINDSSTTLKYVFFNAKVRKC